MKPSGSGVSMTGLEEVTKRIRNFRDERDWMQFHNPKNLACSIVLEAAEILEHFQWKSPEESTAVSREKHDEIASEIADVGIYLIELADNLGVDLVKAIQDKLIVNASRYPVGKAKGSASKYTEL